MTDAEDGLRRLSASRRAALVSLIGLPAAACASRRFGLDSLDRFVGEADAAPRPALALESAGQGRPVLLVHGLGTNTYSWRFLVPPLQARHRLHRVDLLGFGRSPKPPLSTYGPYDHADRVHDLILAEGWRDLTLVGHSLGGGVALLVALRLARSDPGRLASLVLVDPVAYGLPLPPLTRIGRVPLLARAIGALPPRVLVRTALEVIFHDRRRITADMVEAYARPLGEPGGRHALVETTRLLVPPDNAAVAALYPALRLPTLVVWGRHDAVLPLGLGERLVASLPEARLAVVEAAGHAPQEEQPEATLAALAPLLPA